MQILTKQLLADAFEITVADVPDDASLEAFEHWDSLGHVRLINAVEERLGRQLETLEILGLVDLESLGHLLDVSTT